MAERVYLETVDMAGLPVPLRLFDRRTDSGSKGCYFNRHVQMEFFCVKSGGILLQCGGNSEWISAGDIGVVNSGEPHRSLQFQDGTYHHVIQIDIARVFGGTGGDVYKSHILPLIGGEAGICNYIRRDAVLPALFRHLIDEYERRAEGYELAVAGYAHLIFCILLRDYSVKYGPAASGLSRGKNRAYADAILSYVEAHYRTGFRLEDIAGSLHITVPHLCRVFRAETGSSIVQYGNLIRCHRARVLLESGFSVTETADRVGFSDPNYFSRVFKRDLGFSPSAVRKKA